MKLSHYCKTHLHQNFTFHGGTNGWKESNCTWEGRKKSCKLHNMKFFRLKWLNK